MSEREKAFAALEERKLKAEKEGQIDNASLHAGSPMYYYCRFCGLQSDELPEGWYVELPKKVCADCQIMEAKGYLE